jgi:hypothetical protein
MMPVETKEAYEMLEFTENKPTESGVYIAVCGESDWQPYKITVDSERGVINDETVGTVTIEEYHWNLDCLMYKRIGDLL